MEGKATLFAIGLIIAVVGALVLGYLGISPLIYGSSTNMPAIAVGVALLIAGIILVGFGVYT